MIFQSVFKIKQDDEILNHIKDAEVYVQKVFDQRAEDHKNWLFFTKVMQDKIIMAEATPEERSGLEKIGFVEKVV